MADETVERPEGEEVEPVPWHFKLLLLGLVLYLAYRLVQALIWAAQKLF